MPTNTAIAKPVELEELQPLPETALELLSEPGSNLPVKANRGINVSGDTLIQSTSYLPDDQRALVRWAYDYAQDQEWTYAEAATQFGVSQNLIYRVFTDRYRYDKTHPKAGQRIPLDGFCKDLARAKTLILERATVGRLPFIRTSVYPRVEKICDQALLTQSIAFIYGESQIGKTESVLEYLRTHNHGTTKYVRIPAASGVQYLVRQIAAACRINSDRGIETLRGRILKALDPGTLLILDEIHQIFVTYNRAAVLRSLEIIREFYDRSGCGLVCVGNDDCKEWFNQSDYSKFLKQFSRRGVLELQLPPVAPRSDLDLIAREYKLGAPTGEAEALVLAIAKEHGLGRYFKFLRIGARFAQKKNQKYTWDHFLNAYDLLAHLKTVKG